MHEHELRRRQEAHLAWVVGGRVGPGRFELGAVDETGARMRGLRLPFSRFEGTKLSGASLLMNDLAGAELVDVALEGALLGSIGAKGSRWERCVLTKAAADRADLVSAMFVDCDLSGASLRRASLGGATFRGCRLEVTDLADALWEGHTRFESCTLRQARLAAVDGKEGNSLARLRDVAFVGCDLRGVDVSGARLEGVTLEDCQVGGLLGAPASRGITLVRCDRSPAGDGSDVVGGGPDLLWP